MLLARRYAAVVGFSCAVLLSSVTPAEAAFPGRNGLIAVTREGPPFNSKSPPEGAFTIWAVNPRNGRARQLTHVSRRCGAGGWTWGDSELSYSASGRLIAYSHVDSCDPRIADGLYIMRADGSGRRLIRRETTSDKNDIPEFPAISPSGKLLAFDQFLGSTYITSTSRGPDDHRDLGVERDLGVDCPKEKCPLLRYSAVQHPAWSPTGQRLALTLSGVDGEGDAGHIGTVDTRGLGLRLVTRSRRDAMPDWSPAGDRIVFHRERYFRGRWEGNIFTAPAHANRPRLPRRLTATRNAFFPVWSPNARYIAYLRDPNAFLGPASLWIMRANGGAQRLIATNLITDKISWQPLRR